MNNMIGQVSIEYLVLFSLSSTVLLIVLLISFSANINLFQIQDTLMSFRNANAVASAINYVYLAGDGASYNLTMSGVANDENITVSQSLVQSDRKYATISAPLLDSKASAAMPRYGVVTIANNKGEINVSN
jgi:hypothetical protein